MSSWVGCGKRALAFSDLRVTVRGGGDLGSGVVYRLHRAGFTLQILELERPMLVRPAVSFGTAIFDGSITVDGVTARHFSSPAEYDKYPLKREYIPVYIDPDGAYLPGSDVVIDARMAKVNLGTRITDAPLVVALGPGFTAHGDCHAVIETNRGHNLGRAYYNGSAEPDTGTPGVVNGRGAERVVRAPEDGYITRQIEVGETVREGQSLAWINDTTPLLAPFDGILRGLIHPGVFVRKGQKVGDVDPRAKREHCFTISDKALAIGGGVLEAVLSSEHVRARLAGAETRLP